MPQKPRRSANSRKSFMTHCRQYIYRRDPEASVGDEVERLERMGRKIYRDEALKADKHGGLHISLPAGVDEVHFDIEGMRTLRIDSAPDLRWLILRRCQPGLRLFVQQAPALEKITLPESDDLHCESCSGSRLHLDLLEHKKALHVEGWIAHLQFGPWSVDHLRMDGSADRPYAPLLLFGRGPRDALWRGLRLDLPDKDDKPNTALPESELQKLDELVGFIKNLRRPSNGDEGLRDLPVGGPDIVIKIDQRDLASSRELQVRLARGGARELQLRHWPKLRRFKLQSPPTHRQLLIDMPELTHFWGGEVRDLLSVKRCAKIQHMQVSGGRLFMHESPSSSQAAFVHLDNSTWQRIRIRDSSVFDATFGYFGELELQHCRALERIALAPQRGDKKAVIRVISGPLPLLPGEHLPFLQIDNGVLNSLHRACRTGKGRGPSGLMQVSELLLGLEFLAQQAAQAQGVEELQRIVKLRTKLVSSGVLRIWEPHPRRWLNYARWLRRFDDEGRALRAELQIVLAAQRQGLSTALLGELLRQGAQHTQLAVIAELIESPQTWPQQRTLLAEILLQAYAGAIETAKAEVQQNGFVQQRRRGRFDDSLAVQAQNYQRCLQVIVRLRRSDPELSRFDELADALATLVYYDLPAKSALEILAALHELACQGARDQLLQMRERDDLKARSRRQITALLLKQPTRKVVVQEDAPPLQYSLDFGDG